MRPRQFTDEEMIREARRCFLEHGPGVAMSVIAEQLSVSPAALFRRVGSKRELLIRALSPSSLPPFIETLRRGPDARPVSEQIEAIALEIDGFFEGLLPVVSVMRVAGIDPHELFEKFEEPPPALSVRALAAWFATLADQGRVRIDKPFAAAMAFIGGLQGRHFLRHACGAALPPAEPDAAMAFARIFSRGIIVSRADQTPESSP
ncbi:MAG: TetR/AcrR family transcriptional regulator [Nannocystaceae bacterium]|nr:TetR/AcrR family transcriptional regulator [Nannocystaceae bacterium]